MPEKSEWRKNIADEIRALRGGTVQRFVGWEMALLGDGDEDAQFTHPNVSCLQVGVLYIELHNRPPVKLLTYQDDLFGLELTAVPEDERFTQAIGTQHGIYRYRELDELPTGKMEAVEVKIEYDEVAAVTLRINGRQILLMAGEVYETWDEGRFEFAKLDESILIFESGRC